MTMLKQALCAEPNARHEALRRAAPMLVLVLGLLALTVLAGYGEVVTQRRVILCLINVVVVVGLYIFMGTSGVLNFSAVGFMAIGAYTAALLTMRPMLKQSFLPDLPAWLAMAELPLVSGPVLGGLVAAAVALVVGAPIMRLSGIAAGIATFSLMFIVYVVLGNWNSLTGGQTSLMGLKTWVGLWPAAFFAVAAVILAWLYQNTRWALALQASREDGVAALASGIRIVRLRVGAFVLSAFVCGMGGGLYGHFQGTLRIDSFYLDPTFLYVVMLVVGGTRSLTGAVVGTVTVAALAELLRQIEVGLPLPGTEVVLSAPAGLGDVVLAALMLLVLIYRPQGIVRNDKWMDRFFGRRSATSTSIVPEPPEPAGKNP